VKCLSQYDFNHKCQSVENFHDIPKYQFHKNPIRCPRTFTHGRIVTGQFYNFSFRTRHTACHTKVLSSEIVLGRYASLVGSSLPTACPS
jgi:hypothetical protein